MLRLFLKGEAVCSFVAWGSAHFRDLWIRIIGLTWHIRKWGRKKEEDKFPTEFTFGFVLYFIHKSNCNLLPILLDSMTEQQNKLVFIFLCYWIYSFFRIISCLSSRSSRKLHWWVRLELLTVSVPSIVDILCWDKVLQQNVESQLVTLFGLLKYLECWNLATIYSRKINIKYIYTVGRSISEY